MMDCGYGELRTMDVDVGDANTDANVDADVDVDADARKRWSVM